MPYANALQQEAILQQSITHDKTLHEELLQRTKAILDSRGSAWGLLTAAPPEQEQCAQLAEDYEAEAQEMRAAIKLMVPLAKKTTPATTTTTSSKDEVIASTEEEAEAGVASTTTTATSAPSSDDAATNRTSGFFGAIKGLLLPRVNTDLTEALKDVERLDLLSECFKTQAELDVSFWKTNGGYVKPEETSLLYLARQIIICEGEKERFCENLDRHDEGACEKLEDLSKRLLRYKSIFHIRAERWFSVFSEEYQVAADPHFPSSKPTPFHVQCFFDGTVTEEDLKNNTVGLKIQKAEKKRRFSLFRKSSAMNAGVLGAAAVAGGKGGVPVLSSLSGFFTTVAHLLTSILDPTVLLPFFAGGNMNKELEGPEGLDAEGKEVEELDV